ncbi:hypothetical protein C9374_006038 [Naegleria lovaniensis]|uniref:Uncharacterized protein n=1 Tax=Naegleria lovaniensis TaxID=51637 RepID=A0AA88GMF6_NAELO|nr:uncharacterized protein C9374_006038 [Naegleria lovaniensis]KAG2381654.1 hypothetical protein C9374_006038 [Naegleria lovaniensis]
MLVCTLNQSTTSYATTSDVKTLSYQVSVLQVVVVINSVLIGFILLLALVLVATNCREDYKTLASEVLEGYEDPLWLKFFHLVNTLTYLMLCQCCCPTHMKRKMQVFRVFNEEEWRRWHHNDLKMQRGLISEDDNHDGQLVMPNPTTVNSQSSL